MTLLMLFSIIIHSSLIKFVLGGLWRTNSDWSGQSEQNRQMSQSLLSDSYNSLDWVAGTYLSNDYG